MKITVIGDIHSRPQWTKILRHYPDSDLYICLGDYVDPYNEGDHYPTNKEVVTELQQIIAWKEMDPRVILLLGNHDTHYLYPHLEPCSRYNRDLASSLGDLYSRHLHLFQFAYQVENHLFTHAGISQSWWERHSSQFYQWGFNGLNLATLINEHPEYAGLHEVGTIRGGDFPSGGITWADKHETRNFLSGYHQYVGHSKVQFVDCQTKNGVEGSITYCDTLHKEHLRLKYDILTLDL